MSDDSFTDHIHIEQLEIFASVGVTQHERATPQRLTLNITAWPVASFDDLGDDISRTVNYSALSVAAREFAEERSTALIETLADQLAVYFLANFPLRKIQLELRKFVLPDAAYAAVGVIRIASGN